MIIISAMSCEGHYIGQGEGMPWNVPEEYQQYLRFIDGQTIVMGRRSYDIFGPDLTSTYNIVISRTADKLPGAIVCPGLEEAIATANSFGKTVFIGGGASVYRQTLPLADKMFLSFIKGDFTGDAQFPDFNENNWEIEKREDRSAFEFVIYCRKPSIADRTDS